MMMDLPAASTLPTRAREDVVALRHATFDHAAALFAELREGACMGLVAQSTWHAGSGRRIAAMRAVDAGAVDIPMLAFEAMGGRIRVDARRFEGVDRAGVDLLFVAEDRAQAALEALPGDAVLPAMKRLLREGAVMFYVFRGKAELQDAGYEDFLDSLGLAFLGACR
jgi:hypothetical protein